MFEIPKINNINFIILQAEEDEYQKNKNNKILTIVLIATLIVIIIIIMIKKRKLKLSKIETKENDKNERINSNFEDNCALPLPATSFDSVISKPINYPVNY